MGPYRESRLKSLILVMSAIITLSGCATSVSFQSADRSTTVDGTLFKPDGAGPFPGVVLLHGCGGIRPHFVQWAGAIRDMGYVALLVDSFRPRGISGICASSPTMASMTTDRVADAYGALRQLKALPFVDGDRVALMGWSHGGWTTLEAMASWRYRSSPDQFRAAIAFYPYCRDALNEPFRAPLLVLIGGSDDWTPAKKCEDMQARLRLVNPDAAQSLRVQVYQGAHHDFDDVAAKNCCGHTLRYNRDAAKDAEDQVRRFLAEHMKGAQREGGGQDPFRADHWDPPGCPYTEPTESRKNPKGSPRGECGAGSAHGVGPIGSTVMEGSPRFGSLARHLVEIPPSSGACR